jgi:hypothetical protein
VFLGGDGDLAYCIANCGRAEFPLAFALEGCDDTAAAANDDVDAELLVTLTAKAADLILGVHEVREIGRELLKSIWG